MPLDPTPYFKLGGYGVLLFLLIGAVFIAGFLLKQLLAKSTSTGPAVREPTAGEKNAEFWQKDYDSRAAAQTKIVVEHLGKIRARLREIDGKIDRFDASVKEDFQQLRRDVATLARAIELRDRGQ